MPSHSRAHRLESLLASHKDELTFQDPNLLSVPQLATVATEQVSSNFAILSLKKTSTLHADAV